MRLKDHVRRGLQAWLPKNYRSLSVHPFKEWISTFSFWVVLSLLVMVVIGIPKILLIPQMITSTADSFDTFNMSANVSLEGSQTLVNHPLIVIDLEKESLTKERVLLTDEGIHVRKPFWQGNTLLEWQTITDVPRSGSLYATIVFWLFLLALPALIVVSSVIVAFEVAVLACIAAVLSFIVSRATKFSISFKQISKICLMSSVPFVMVQVLPFLYLRWFVIPVIAYFLLVAVSVWFVGESKLDQKMHKKSSSADK